jgi:hypothetical protein
VKTSGQDADGAAIMKEVMKAIARVGGGDLDPYLIVDALAYVIGVILASAEGAPDDERIEAVAAVAARRFAAAMRDFRRKSGTIGPH